MSISDRVEQATRIQTLTALNQRLLSGRAKVITCENCGRGMKMAGGECQRCGNFLCKKCTKICKACDKVFCERHINKHKCK